jgi:hypothetical protein
MSSRETCERSVVDGSRSPAPFFDRAPGETYKDIVYALRGERNRE